MSALVKQINDTIAQGGRVYATHSDLRRAGQPTPGQTVRVTKAFEEASGGRVRVNAEGYKGRFSVTDVTGLAFDTTPDTY